MTAREPIVLPESRVAMTWDGPVWRAPNGACIGPCGVGPWRALNPGYGTHFDTRAWAASDAPNQPAWIGTRAECIKWLDKGMLAAQHAVMPPGGVIVVPEPTTLVPTADDAVRLPPGGFVVVDDDATVEKIARVIHEAKATEWTWDGLREQLADAGDSPVARYIANALVAPTIDAARAVLAAIKPETKNEGGSK